MKLTKTATALDFSLLELVELIDIKSHIGAAGQELARAEPVLASACRDALERLQRAIEDVRNLAPDSEQARAGAVVLLRHVVAELKSMRETGRAIGRISANLYRCDGRIISIARGNEATATTAPAASAICEAGPPSSASDLEHPSIPLEIEPLP